MQITKSEGETGSVLKVKGTLELSGAEEFHKALCDFLVGPSSLTVDLADVESCDAAGLQLLCSAQKTAERSAKHLRIVGLCRAARETGAALGLAMGDVDSACQGASHVL